MASKLERWQTAAERASINKANNKYEADPIQVKKRENRNKARYNEEKAGKVHKGDGKDIAHKDGSALNNDPANWAVQSRHKNRSYKRTKGAHKADPHSWSYSIYSFHSLSISILNPVIRNNGYNR